MRHFFFTSALIGLSALVACGDDTNSGGGGNAPSGGGPTTGGAGGEGATGATGGTGGAGAEGGAGDGTGATGGAGGGVGANGPGFTCDPAEGVAPTLGFTTITEEVDRPVGVRSPPGRPDTLFIWEQHEGTIVIYENGALLPTPFLNVEPLIRKTNEEGLLGLAFHPDYATNGRFFIHYSATGSGRSTIAEYHRSDADPNVADPDEVQRVLDIDTEEGNHNGGALEFGNDGFLYISFGDGGGGNDPDCDAQDLDVDNLLGKLVRLDVNAAPDENGYPAAAGNPEGYKYYHVGLRNPWRFSFDRCTGDTYIADVGQGEWEEVNVVGEAEGPLNFGWPYREGMHDFDPGNVNCPGGGPTLEEPIVEYDHSGGKCSISGGVLYRGSAIPGLRGAYFYGDACSGEVWMITAAGGALTGGPTSLGQLGSISGFGNDGNGEVYVVDLTSGIYRIDQE